MQLSYQPARPEDAPAIFGFAKELIETYETDPALDLEMALNWTERKIEKRIDEYTRVLWDGKTAAYYRFAPDGERMELDDLYVLPEYRNRGIGAALLKKCEEAFPGKNFFLNVDTANESAIRLYERSGYRQTGIERSYYMNGHDALIMKKGNRAHKDPDVAV